MTIDRIRITTQEQADAVPEWSRCTAGRFAGFHSASPGRDLTHIAIPVADAIEARRVLIGILPRIADLILPPPLAEAAEQQAKPDTVMVELPRDVAERVAGWKGGDHPGEKAVVASVRAALDDERGGRDDRTTG